jgi:hypothetical protein
MAAPPSYAESPAEPAPGGAALAAMTDHNQRWMELTAAADDDERTGGDRSALLNPRHAPSAPSQQPMQPAPWLAAAAAKGDGGLPARIAARGARVGGARLQLKWPKWLLKGRGWQGPLPLKWCA